MIELVIYKLSGITRFRVWLNILALESDSQEQSHSK